MNGTATRQAPVSPASAWKPAVACEPWGQLEQAHPAKSRNAATQSGKARQAIYVAMDLALVGICCTAGYWLRFGITKSIGVSHAAWSEAWPPLAAQTYPGFLLLYGALIVLSCFSLDLYRTTRELRAREEAFRVLKAVFTATALLVLFIFTSGNTEISRAVIIVSGALNVSTLAGWRYAKRRYVLQRAYRGEGLSRALIIGAGKTGQLLAAWLTENRELGYCVCGFLDAHPNGDPLVLGTIRDLRSVALGQFADHVFVTLPVEREIVKEVFFEAQRLRLSLKVVPDLYDGLAWRAPLQSLGGLPVIELHGKPIPVFGLAAKRLMDIAGAAAGLALTAPLLALAALWIRLDSRGPVFLHRPARRAERKKISLL